MSKTYTLEDLLNSHINELNKKIEGDLSWKFITENNLIDEFKKSLSLMMISEVESVNEFIRFINSNIIIDRICYKNIEGKSGISLFSNYDCLNILCFEKTENQLVSSSSGYTGLNMTRIPDTRNISIYPIELYFTKNLSYSFQDHRIHYDRPVPSYSNHSRSYYNNTINQIVSKCIENIYNFPYVNLEIEKKIQNARRASQEIGDFYNKIFDYNLESFLCNKDLLLIDFNNLDKELLENISINEITKDNYFNIAKEIKRIQNIIAETNTLISDTSSMISDVNNYYDTLSIKNQ